MDSENDLALLHHIFDVSRQMAETRSLTPLLDYSMREAIALIGAERGYLVLHTPDDTLTVRAFHGPDDETPDQAANDQISMTILEQVVSTGKSRLVKNALADQKLNRQRSVIRLALRSVLCVPLIASGNTVGAIYLENRSVSGRFNDKQLSLLELFANQAAVSIENARLNDHLETLVDERTRELQEAKSALEHNWAEAVEVNRLRTTLLANIVHDLRAPLTIIVGSLGMIADGTMGELNAEQVDWIDRSRNSATHVLSLIDDVFDLTKLDMGVLSLDKEEVNFVGFLQDIFRIAQGLPWPNTVSLQLDLPSEMTGQKVQLDPVRIRQVLLNLLSNALKFTKEGSVTIHARSDPEQNAVVIGVRDTGEGIDPEKVGRVFERFQQVDENKSRRRTGTGLGLTISRDLVQMHGGRIWVESEVGVGSNFIFALPLRQA